MTAVVTLPGGSWGPGGHRGVGRGVRGGVGGRHAPNTTPQAQSR